MIVNVEILDTKKFKNRTGSDVDAENLRNLFDDLCFTVDTWGPRISAEVNHLTLIYS